MKAKITWAEGTDDLMWTHVKRLAAEHKLSATDSYYCFLNGLTALLECQAMLKKRKKGDGR